MEEKLTGVDYMTNSWKELRNHPDFSPHAFRVIAAISQMTTEEIEKLDLIGGTTSGTN